MKTEIIACQTIRRELLAAAGNLGCTYPIHWIESGLHNVPAMLHDTLQKALDDCAGCERVLLAFGFCGNAAAGLHSDTAELVLPRVDDCISLLCGSVERRVGFRETYFFTEGWLSGERTIWHEFSHAAARYGEERAKRIFQSMLRNYRHCALLDTGCFPIEPAEKEVRRIAQALGLEFCSIEGTIAYLERLLSGPWEPEAFVVVPPGATLPQSQLRL
ncbi:MAG: DUF1638 domain-containing protein [Oscillibacter sp.]|nr:DUF1638 domain-containing protein [Oscillibacter sp.]